MLSLLDAGTDPTGGQHHTFTFDQPSRLVSVMSCHYNAGFEGGRWGNAGSEEIERLR